MTKTVTDAAVGSQASDLWIDGSFRLDHVEKRAHKRFSISLLGVCCVASGPDIACSTQDVSLGGMALYSKARVLPGQWSLVSLPQVGLLRGHVARQWTDGFALAFEESKAQRKRIGNFLTWLSARCGDPTFEDRACERIVPLRRMITLTTPDGTTSMARILDVSRSGVAVTTTAATAVGDVVRLGNTEARVTRLIESGFAAQFEPQIDGLFDASIRL